VRSVAAAALQKVEGLEKRVDDSFRIMREDLLRMHRENQDEIRAAKASFGEMTEGIDEKLGGIYKAGWTVAWSTVACLVTIIIGGIAFFVTHPIGMH
jgi:hypothetical protein